jgi:phosphatidylserine/phosphatidylglycerophosphate/cardiolipin synthase-like enzyme
VTTPLPPSEWFISAVHHAIAVMGAGDLGRLGGALIAGRPPDAILDEFPLPETADAAEQILQAADSSGLSRAAAGGYLAGFAAARGDADHRYAREVEVVWSGPTTARIPVRATAQVVIDVVNAARSELLLMTYSAKPYEPLLAALAAAVSRGVHTAVVVETLQGAGSALQGAEPAAAFSRITGLELWHWPTTQRTDPGAKMHAKLVVADDAVLFTTSANLTASGVGRNLEAGLLVRGGHAPGRTTEHIRELQVTGVLHRYH